MSTMNLSGELSLGNESKSLSRVNSLEELDKIMGMKSNSEYEVESEAKEKTVNHLITHAEKVIYYGFIVPYNVYEM
jgi:hypothetical protein